LIAAFIALGKTPEKLSTMYTTLGEVVFDKGTSLYGRHICGKPRYSADRLRAVIEEHIGKDTRLGDCSKQVLIVATRLNDVSVEVFDSSDNAQKRMRMADVLLASTAAPTYFPPHTIADNQTCYLDGGLSCNNPAFECALSLWKRKQSFECVKILSVANGRSPTTPDPDRYASRSPLKWGIGLLEFNMALTASSAHRQCLLALGGERYIRIDPVLSESIALDDAKKAIRMLPALANSAADGFSGAIENWLRF
jgi:patatin-like phospholipase/acyl hydrolase